MDGHDGSFDTVDEPAAEGPLDATDDSAGYSAGDDSHYGMVANDDPGTGTGSDDPANPGTTTGYDAGTDSGTDSGSDSGYGGSTSTTSSGSEIQVDVDGQEYELPATIDVDQDGHLDAAVVHQGDETVLFGDSDGDGKADVAIEYDSSGQPIAMAESDGDGHWEVDREATGGSDPSTDTADTDTASTDSTGYGDDTTTDTTSAGTTTTDTTTGTDGTSGPTVSIQVDGQEYTEAAQYDSSGDGVAQVHLSDGDTVLAGDTNQDGQADVAEIEDSTGQVVDVQYVDPSTGEWVDAGPPQSGS